MKLTKQNPSFFKVLRNKKGQSLVEYALIMAVIAAAAIAALTTISGNVTARLQNTATTTAP